MLDGYTPVLSALAQRPIQNELEQYRLADGSLAPRQRRRTALPAKDGSLSEGPPGGPLVPYGLWRLDEAREKGVLLLVEGESDTLTAWLHNVPCLGIPGADLTKTLKAEALKGIDTVYVVKEPDQGGRTFVAGIRRHLEAIGFTGQAFVISFGDGVKDLNDLHRRAGAHFAEQFAAAKVGAMPLAEGRRRCRIQWQTKPAARGHRVRARLAERCPVRPRRGPQHQ